MRSVDPRVRMYRLFLLVFWCISLVLCSLVFVSSDSLFFDKERQKHYNYFLLLESCYLNALLTIGPTGLKACTNRWIRFV
jgi:hypothetical protein